MYTTNIMRIKKKKGVSTILGTLIFIGILFTSVIPMMLVIKQTDTIFTKKVHEVEAMDDEKAIEELDVYTYPGGGTNINIKVKNKGELPVTIIRVWINNEYNSTNELIPINSEKNIGPFNVPNVEENSTVDVKVVTERGNIFNSFSGNLYYSDTGWSTTSVGICVIIHNPDGGEFQLWLLNGTGWKDMFYESKDKEWEDVIASTPVSKYPNLNYKIDAYQRKGANWKPLPGSPIPSPIYYPDGPPFILIWLEAK